MRGFLEVQRLTQPLSPPLPFKTQIPMISELAFAANYCYITGKRGKYF
jgi:hypothetical protein